MSLINVKIVFIIKRRVLNVMFGIIEKTHRLVPSGILSSLSENYLVSQLAQVVFARKKTVFKVKFRIIAPPFKGNLYYFFKIIHGDD